MVFSKDHFVKEKDLADLDATIAVSFCLRLLGLVSEWFAGTRGLVHYVDFSGQY